MICAITCNDARSLMGFVTDPSVWVQLRDNGRSLSARYWPIVAGERAGTALPTAARSDTGSTASARLVLFRLVANPNPVFQMLHAANPR